MAAWRIAVLLAVVAGSAVFAKEEQIATFPEAVRSGPTRIVSGWEAYEGQIPHQLSLRNVDSQGSVNSCGGSIIHNEWGITAAHCVALRVSIVIRAGCVNMTRPELIFETSTYFTHPLFSDEWFIFVQANDIALLKFERHISYSSRIQPIALQPSSDMNRNYDGIQMVSSGWGHTWTSGESPENLNWVYLKGELNSICAETFGSLVENTTICARYYNVTSQSVCQGDSGGPLTVLEDDGILTLIGVASFVSAAGCHTGLPSGFTRPGFYHNWYFEATGINFDWVR